MKRYLIFLAAFFCAVISCSQEEILKTDEVKLVPVTIFAESGDFDTKSIATWNSQDSKYNIKWEANDALSVFTNIDTDNHKFTARQTAKLATFTGELPAGDDVTIYPIMPYDKDAYISGYTVYTSIPDEQDGDFYNVVLAGWPRPDTKAEGEKDFFYQFEAVSGILKFHFDHTQIADFESKAQHVVRLSITADRPIAGDAKVSFTGGKPVMTADPNGTGSNMRNTISISAPDGAQSLPDGDYYIATLPINKADFPAGMGISVKCETKEGEVAYINATIGGEGKQHILTANVVKNIGTVITTNYVPHITNGEFTVAAGPKKVSFSPGNLQYRASDGRWRFAPNQYDAQGEVGNLTRPASVSDDGDRKTQSDWIDLFPYGHSGCEYKGVTYQPYKASAKAVDYFANYYATVSLIQSGNKNGDWGVYHDGEIYYGNNKSQDHWRLLTASEFDYMMNTRTVNSVTATFKNAYEQTVTKTAELRFLRCGIKTGVYDEKGDEIIRYCLMLFPDGYSWPYEKIDVPFVANTSVTCLAIGYKTIDNKDCPLYNLSQLAVFESGSVALLPCAGHRLGAEQNEPFTVSFAACNQTELSGQSSLNQEGHYWTSTKANARVNRSKNANLEETYTSPADAKSVRLVKNGTGF